jgi:hypothetical protein
VVWPPWSTSNAAPSPIKTPRREKPKYQITFPEHIVIRRVTPQNRHLADYSDHATIYMMLLRKRTTKRLMHIATYT